MWLVGMNEAAEGYVAIRAIHDPLSVAPSAIGTEIAVKAFIESVSQHARVNLPLGIAQMLLGSALVLVAIKALVARRASASFALQMLLANAALLVTGYALREPVRGAIVDQWIAGGLGHPPKGMSVTQFAVLARTQLWWSFRIALGLQLGTLALCAFAITRKTARQLLAPASPHPEEH